MLSVSRPSQSILRALSRPSHCSADTIRTVLSRGGLSKSSRSTDLSCSSRIQCSIFSRPVSNTSFTPLSSSASAAAAASAPSAADVQSLVTTVAPPRPGIAVPTEWGEIEGFFDKHALQGQLPAMSMPMLESPVEDVPLDSIIKVFAVVSPPNYIQPWQNKPLKEVTGSGFAIKGRRVLTNAHVVADQKYVMVKRQGSAIKFHAQVEAVGHECDLAVLTIKDERFWDNMEELEFADIPNLQEQVTVVGYPIGGDNLSVTKGVVSRVEPQQYAHGASKLLAIQIDAAINPGNSGGPAVQGRKVVGVAFQNLQGAENIGFIIPVPIIKHFLNDIERHKAYVGFCELGIMCQTLENPYFQKVMNLSPQESSSGIVVNFVAKVSPAYGVLKKFDVITAVDGHTIACDGSVHFRGRERIPFDYLLSHKYAGDPCHLDIIRNGVSMKVVVNMQPVNHLVPVFQYDTMPSFLIYAGLVFVPLTQPYLHEYGYDWYDRSPRRLCHLAMNGKRKYPDQQVVILSQVLIDDVNVGYQRAIDSVITRVNGIEVRNLKHLREILDQISAQTTVDQMAVSSSSSSSTTSISTAATETQTAQMRSIHTSAAPSSSSKSEEDTDIDIAVRVPGTVVFETDDHRLIVIDAAAAKASESALLERHRIPASRSPDLQN